MGFWRNRDGRRKAGDGVRLDGEGGDSVAQAPSSAGVGTSEKEEAELQRRDVETTIDSLGGSESELRLAEDRMRRPGETRAEVARRRIKLARGALEDALDELGRSALDELGLAPPELSTKDPETVSPSGKGEKEGGRRRRGRSSKKAWQPFGWGTGDDGMKARSTSPSARKSLCAHTEHTLHCTLSCRSSW